MKLIGGSSSLEGVVTDMNQNILELKGRETTEIFKDDSGTRRVLLGKGADDFYGLKVSPAGTDVYTAAAADLVFNSDQNVFKIVDKLTTTFSYSVGASASTNSFTLNHNLGYLPLLSGSVNITSASGTATTGVYPLPYLLIGANSTINGGYIAAGISITEVTTTLVHFSMVLASSSSFAGTVTLYVLQETAT